MNLQRNRRGAAMVEFALILPVLIVLTVGLIEFGWGFLKASQLNNAARQGVRAAIIPSATSTSVQAAVSQVMTQDSIPTSAYTVTITNLNTAVGNPVTVQIVMNYPKVSLLSGGGFLPIPQTLTAVSTMTKEGP